MWIAVNGLIFAAVNCEICLPVAIQIKLAERNTSLDRFLEYPSGYDVAMPQHLARKPGIDGNYFHVRWFLSMNEL